jgi:hypothetical protein
MAPTTGKVSCSIQFYRKLFTWTIEIENVSPTLCWRRNLRPSSLEFLRSVQSRASAGVRFERNSVRKVLAQEASECLYDFFCSAWENAWGYINTNERTTPPSQSLGHPSFVRRGVFVTTQCSIWRDRIDMISVARENRTVSRLPPFATLDVLTPSKTVRGNEEDPGKIPGSPISALP